MRRSAALLLLSLLAATACIGSRAGGFVLPVDVGATPPALRFARADRCHGADAERVRWGAPTSAWSDPLPPEVHDTDVAPNPVVRMYHPRWP